MQFGSLSGPRAQNAPDMMKNILRENVDFLGGRLQFIIILISATGIIMKITTAVLLLSSCFSTMVVLI